MARIGKRRVYDENSENERLVMDDDSSENEGSLLDDDNNSENERLMSDDESGQMGRSAHDESASEKGCKNGKNDSLTEIVKIEECEQGLEDKSHSVYQTAFCSMDKSVVTIDLTTEDNKDSSDHFSKGKRPELSQSGDSFDTLHNTDSSEDSSDNESSVHKRRSYLDERKSFFDEEDEFLVRKK